MSTFIFHDKKVFYRTVGKGDPLLILNGIMMSTRSWVPFESHFTRENQLILLDLLDQGESDKMESDYDQSIQAEVVGALLDELGLEKVSIIGTSYGGEVALQFAAKHPDRIKRMVLANTVARTNAWLREIGDAWNYATKVPEAYYCTTIPTIYSPAYYDRKKDWMANRKAILTKTAFADEDFLNSMIRLTKSAESHDVTEQLPNIHVPTLVVSCDQDHITPMEEQRLLVSLMPDAEMIILPETGHAAFYERPYLFTSLVLGFINGLDAEITV